MAPSERSSATVRLGHSPELGAPQTLQDRVAGRVRPMLAVWSVSRERIASLDVLRILAAIAIVWFHTVEAPYRRIGYAGLPVFLLIFLSLIVRRGCADGVPRFLQRRWHRLLEPWLFWSVVYGAGQLGKAIYAGDLNSLGGMLSVETFLAGTCIHLWYLPYAFVSGLLVYLLTRRTARSNAVTVVILSTLTGVLTLAACAIVLSQHRPPYPLPQWEFGLAAIPLGFAVGRCVTVPSPRARTLLLSMVAGTTLIGCTLLISRGLPSPAIPYGIATVLVCVAYAWPGKGNGLLAALASLTFGVYLVHPLVASGLRPFFSVQQNYIAFIAWTVCVSAVVTLGLLRTPLRRFV